MSFFKDLFSRKDKEKEKIDPLNIKLTALKEGYILDYDLHSWEVKEVYNYDWGDAFFTKEYKLFNGTDIRYLHVEEDDELLLEITEKVRPATIDPDLAEYIGTHGHPPKKMHYKGTDYHLDSESPGYFNTEGKTEQWVEHISWAYYSQDETKILNIEQWGEHEFEASIGKVVEPFEISNIIPSK